MWKGELRLWRILNTNDSEVEMRVSQLSRRKHYELQIYGNCLVWHYKNVVKMATWKTAKLEETQCFKRYKPKCFSSSTQKCYK